MHFNFVLVLLFSWIIYKRKTYRKININSLTYQSVCHTLVCNMAKQPQRSRMLPSDPDYLLQYFDALPSDDSEDDFDGYHTNGQRLQK